MPAPVERRHRGVLPTLSAEAARAVLSSPRLPLQAMSAAELAREAAALALPVRLAMPAAAGRVLVARALHTVSERRGPLVTSDGRARGLCDLPAGTSVLIDAEALTVPAAAALEALLDDGDAWVLLASEPDLPLPPGLAPRFDVVTMRVPPLSARAAELPAVAQHLLATLAARRGGTVPVLTAAAVAYLAAQPWPGDLAELEAALGKGLLRAGRSATSIDAVHFGLDLGDAPVAAPAPADHGAQLEYLVAQLAHELRNPLASVRTFSQLPGLAEDAELRARFVAITDDAITRMDGLLETVSTFAHLGTPTPAEVALGPLIDGLVAEVRPGLAERAVRLDYASPNGARCHADAEQLTYALRTALDGVVREVSDQDAVRIDAATPGRVCITFDPRNGTAERLKRVLQPDGRATNGGDVLPLALVLARAVLARNGGSLEVAPQADGRALVDIRLPAAGTAGGG